MTNQPLKTRSFVDHFLCLLFGLILFFNLVWLPNVLATDCGSTTIPQAECQALIMLYNSTDGPNWLDYSSNNWNVTNTPCTTWAGITCESEHITGIDRNNQGLKNKLGSTPVPLDLTALSNLQLLDLSENQLESIPDLSDLTHLQLINLNKNQLKGFIPDFLSTLTDLQYLDLSDNQLSGFIPDAEILGLLTKLSDLYLDHNQLSGP
jgi:Leucine-rich repeat (LRR) protein